MPRVLSLVLALSGPLCGLPDRAGLTPSDGGAADGVETDAGSDCPPGRADVDGDGTCECLIQGPDTCDLVDNDCDPSTPDGSANADFGQPCDGIDADECADGIFVCEGGALRCDDATDDNPDLCNGLDDDCDPTTPDGFGDPSVGTGCDGDDPDSCAGGFFVCVEGAVVCEDPGGAGQEICDGIDNDCDPTTPDGSADDMLDARCDGPDSDRCREGRLSCMGGSLVCSDTSGDDLELCNGANDDCRSDTPDGFDEPTLGDGCDGGDSDLCQEGVVQCVDGMLSCSDRTSGSLDVCNGMDDDCDPSSADGDEDAMLGDLCDGADLDRCDEGMLRCVSGGLVCDDTTDDIPDLCNGDDDDCRPGTPDGSGDARIGVPCDGADADRCEEGTTFCGGGAVMCSDDTDDTLELCNGMNDDCRAGTPDGADDPRVAVPCDGPDADLCEEGTTACMGGTVTCDDTSGDDVETCNDGDDDCDGSVDEGVTQACMNACGDPGTETCTAGVFGGCDAPAVPTETCNAVDDDCDGVVDEAVCTGCSRFVGGGRLYLECDGTPATWLDARDDCRSRGYELVQVDDAAEQGFLETELTDGRSYWMGLNDRDVEGTYVWADGGALGGFEDWRGGAPVADPDLDCALLLNRPARTWPWELTDCDDTETYVCEADDPRP
ncbi:MAG: C-type lectin domain-containing protein [Myxococcota bacterium]